MSKRQRDSLIAEVERHRQQQQQQQLQEETQSLLSCPAKTRQDRTMQLLQPGYSFAGDNELMSYATDVHPYLVCSPGESQVSNTVSRGSGISPVSRSQGRGDSGAHHDIRGGTFMSYSRRTSSMDRRILDTHVPKCQTHTVYRTFNSFRCLCRDKVTFLIIIKQ